MCSGINFGRNPALFGYDVLIEPSCNNLKLCLLDRVTRRCRIDVAHVRRLTVKILSFSFFPGSTLNFFFACALHLFCIQRPLCRSVLVLILHADQSTSFHGLTPTESHACMTQKKLGVILKELSYSLRPGVCKLVQTL
jgi:hypothetical protein